MPLRNCSVGEECPADGRAASEAGNSVYMVVAGFLLSFASCGLVYAVYVFCRLFWSFPRTLPRSKFILALWICVLPVVRFTLPVLCMPVVCDFLG
jgi:hypothetical protein